MIRTAGLFRYVPHAAVEDFHRTGWMVIAELGPVHGLYASLMWHCDCADARQRLLFDGVAA